MSESKQQPPADRGNLATLPLLFLIFTAASAGGYVYLHGSPTTADRGAASAPAEPAAANVPSAARPAGRPQPVPPADPQRASYRRPEAVPYPADNPFTPAKELLGRTLFFDPRLSGSNWISCASCHNPAFSWGDGLPKAIGHGMQELGRRTPTILDLAWGELLFWDGRAASLEEQALGPIASAGEMNMPLEQMEAKVRGIPSYRPLFEAAYPGEPVAATTIAKAIATFERTVMSAKAPFDDWVDGQESAISEQAKRGFALFNGKANCAKCHGGWRFTDDGFHDIGVPGDDPGRGKILEGIEAVRFAFKTPTLRNVDHRAPYMHDGSVRTLEDVVALYNRGGLIQRPSLSKEIKPLHLTPEEASDLVAFLKALTSKDKPVEIPVMPR